MMDVQAVEKPLSDLERDANFPTVDEAIEYLKLCELVNKVQGLQYKDEFHAADTANPITPHFFEKNSVGGTAMVVTSDTLKYVAIVFGSPENDETWEDQRRAPIREWGPEASLDFAKGVEINSTPNDALFKDDLYKKLYNDLNAVIREHSDYKVVVTGHSQGGAMSSIFSTYLCHKKPILKVYNTTFGSPRVGGETWKLWVNSLKNLTVWRYVLGADIIPSIPVMTMGYRHVGHNMHLDLNQSTKAYFCPSSPQEEEEALDLSHPHEALTLFESIVSPVKDHGIVEYLSFLNEHAKKDPHKYYARTFDTVGEEKEVEMGMMERMISLCS